METNELVELIERLVFLSKCEKRAEYNDMNVGEELQRAASTIVELLDRAETAENNGWISVNDKQPEKDGVYLAFDSLEVQTAVYDVEKGWAVQVTPSVLVDKNKKISHWMPLPKPPKELNQ